ncbi:MAG: hypothetical protein IKH75_06480 [Ruminococcus sp.]|nr:hypothetical protein [Ruminococcus sp.]
MKTIFDKTEIKDLKLKNRLFRSATWEALADENGHFDEEIYNIYDQLAAGGVGCIISGFTSVSDNGRYFGGMARLSNDGLIVEHKRLTDTVHAHNVPIIAQLALGEYQNKEIRELNDSDIDTIREPDLIDRWQRGECSPAKCVSCNMCYRTPAHKCIFRLRGIE